VEALEALYQGAQIAVAASLVAAVEAPVVFNKVGSSADHTVGEPASSNIFVVCQMDPSFIQPPVHLYVLEEPIFKMVCCDLRISHA
jgi:hypothetical protein